MSDALESKLVGDLADAQAMETQALQLLSKCIDNAGDESIAAIYRTHRGETEQHAKDIAARLSAHVEVASRAGDSVSRPRAPEIDLQASWTSDTPAKLAIVAYAFENLEIAAYHLLRGVAQRAGDQDTVTITERILEQEEATAELLASKFDRILEVSLG